MQDDVCKLVSGYSPVVEMTVYGRRVNISVYRGRWGGDGRRRWAVSLADLGPLPPAPDPMRPWQENEPLWEALYQAEAERTLGRITEDGDAWKVYGPEGLDGFSGGYTWLNTWRSAVQYLVLQNELSLLE